MTSSEGSQVLLGALSLRGSPVGDLFTGVSSKKMVARDTLINCMADDTWVSSRSIPTVGCDT